MSKALPPNAIVAQCARCESLVHQDEVNAEAFELCGDIVCPDCAEEVFEENGQFGVGA